MYLKDYLAACPRDAGIVDFAPAAPLSDFIRRQIKSSGKNISYRTADAFAEGVDDQADITRLDIYRDGQFDFFICSHVLEHVPDDYQALRELHRILKPGGKGILMVPIILAIDEIDEDPSIVDEGERWRRFGQDDHIRLYSKRGFIERIRKSGFSVAELGQDFFGADSFKRNGISDKSVLYVVTK
jgi:SAM-dependent methyltransferase